MGVGNGFIRFQSTYATSSASSNGPRSYRNRTPDCLVCQALAVLILHELRTPTLERFFTEFRVPGAGWGAYYYYSFHANCFGRC